MSRISHKNYIHETQSENSNCGIKAFNRLTSLAPDIHTPNKDDTAENDVQNVTNNSIINNTNNTSEMESNSLSNYCVLCKQTATATTRTTNLIVF